MQKLSMKYFTKKQIILIFCYDNPMKMEEMIQNWNLMLDQEYL